MNIKHKICIVSVMHPSLNPRVVKEADALSANGYDVCLIAPDYSAWGRKADEAFQDRPWRIVAAPKFGPLAPVLTRIRELLRRVVVGFFVNSLHSNVPWLVNSAAHPVAPDLIRAAKKVKADLYIGHLTVGLAAAAIAARVNNSIYAFDAEDFHLGEPPEGEQYNNVRRVIRLIEARYLHDASYISAAAPGIAEAYSTAYNIQPPTVILNVFSNKNVLKQPRLNNMAARKATIYWFSQTIGADRGLECAVRAIALSKIKPRLVLRGSPNAEFVGNLMGLAHSLGIANLVEILEPGDPSQMEVLASKYDVGYVGETGHSPNRRIMLTNKQFTYMLAGLPSIMSDIPSHRVFAKLAPLAVKLFKAEDAESLAGVLDEILGREAHFKDARVAAWDIGQKRFNWEFEQHKLLKLVDGVFHR